MKILLFQGKSWVSKAICWQTRSKYSHAALMLDDGSVIEAWHVGGVLHNKTISTVHSPGTTVKVFEVTTKVDEAGVVRFAKYQLGKKYDFGSILRFLSRRAEPVDNKWFCSELVAAACAAGGVNLLSRVTPHSHLSPRDISLSPLLRQVETSITK